MNYSFTGIFYFFTTIVFAVFTYRLFRVYQKQRTDLTKFIFYGFGSILIFIFLETIITLFFASSSPTLLFFVFIGIFIQFLAIIFLNQTIFPLVFPEIPLKFIQIFTTILTLVVEFLYYNSGRTPILTSDGFINWNFSPLEGFIRFLIMFPPATLGALLFIKQIKTEDKEVRKRAIMFAFIFFVGVILMVTFFILDRAEIIEVIAITFTSLILSLIILLTKKTEELKFISK